MSLVEQLLLALRFNTSISDYLLPISFFDKFLKRDGATFTPSTVLPTILEVLAQEGYCPQRDGEVRIIYKNKGNPCYFFYREDDPEFFLAQASFKPDGYRDVDELLLHQVCSRTNAIQQAGKAYIDEEGGMTFTVESFILSGTPLGPLTLHMCRALEMILAFFHRTLRELTEAQKATKGEADTSTTLLPPSGSLPS